MKNIRYYIFWSLDALTGFKKKKHYDEIAKVYYQKDGYETIQAQRVKEILKYACENTDFYKGFNPNNLKNFPVINKKIINANYDRVLSSEYISQKHRLRMMSTSGSTGETFRVLQNPEKVLRNKIDTLFFYEIGDYDIGDRLYYIRVWTHLNKKKKSSLLLENFEMVDTSKMSEKGWSSFKKNLLKHTQPKVILSYASSLIDFVNSLSEQEKKLKWNVKSIFSGAEELPLNTKRKLSEIFKCPVMSRYSNQEMGIFAQQPITGEDYFLTNEASYHFEFLKTESDEEAQENELARIIVTDLFNKAMPLIRYDTGDLCTFGTNNGRKYIKEVHGRILNILKNRKGDIFSPYTIILLLWNFKGIVQFQLIQEDLDNIVLKLVHNFENKKNVFEQIENELKQRFGQQTNIRIEEVSEIPAEKTGKRKYIISKV